MIKHFSVKGICAASLKQKDRWAFTVIQKSTGDMEFVTCQCTAGRAGPTLLKLHSGMVVLL